MCNIAANSAYRPNMSSAYTNVGRQTIQPIRRAAPNINMRNNSRRSISMYVPLTRGISSMNASNILLKFILNR